MRRNKQFMALILVFSLTLVQMTPVGSGCAATGTSNAKATQNASVPKQWPSPCTSNPCTSTEFKHWFYLKNNAAPTDTPLVLTVTRPSQQRQHTVPPPNQPYVTVGTSGTGLSLQPLIKPWSDNDTMSDIQMWYAIEASDNASRPNPSYLISSLPPHWLGVTGNTNGYKTSDQLAIGFIGNGNNQATLNTTNNQDRNYTLTGWVQHTTWGLATYSSPEGQWLFSVGQTVGISGNKTESGDNSDHVGQWMIQQAPSYNQFVYTIPYQSNSPIQDGNDGNITALAAVYLNQQNASGDYLDATYSNKFQQWNWDNNTQTICNELGVCLGSVDLNPAAGSWVTATPKSILPSPVPANYQWSFYPDRQLTQIIKQTRKGPPFPQLKASEQQKAQNYIAKKLGINAVTCTLYDDNNTPYTYTGIRCQYSNLAAPLSAYLSLIASLPRPPQNVSAQTWKNVKSIILKELTNAIAVRSLYDQILDLYVTAFLGNLDLVNKILADLGQDLTDQTSQKSFDWQEFVEGLMYTLLNIGGAVVGDPELGKEASKAVKTAKKVAAYALPATANLMECGWETYMGEDHTSTMPLANEFEATAAQLYSKFYERFLHLYGKIVDQEAGILQDAGKLKAMGTWAQNSGWDVRSEQYILEVLSQSFQLKVMEQLLPQYFKLYIGMDWVGGAASNTADCANVLNGSTIGYVANSSRNTNGDSPGSLTKPPSSTPQLLNQFATPKDPQGSQWGMWDTGWLYMSASPGNGSNLSDTYLTQQLAEDVQYANPYLLYNGLGGWSGFYPGAGNIADVNCDGAIITLTNFTPIPLTVFVASSKNTALGGGYGTYYGSALNGPGISYSNPSSNTGVVGPLYRSLPPYGTMQLVGSTINGTGSAETQTLYFQIWDYNASTAEPVAGFNVMNYGCASGSSQVKDPFDNFANFNYHLSADTLVNNSNSYPGTVALAVYRSSN